MKLAVSKVLVGIDGSDHSFRAAQYALEISKKYVAKLIAVTVIYMPAKSRMSQQEAIEVPDFLKWTKQRHGSNHLLKVQDRIRLI